MYEDPLNVWGNGNSALICYGYISKCILGDV